MHVHGRRQAAKPGIRKGQHRLRRFKARAGRKLPVKIRRADALHHARQPLQAAPRRGIVAAGIDQIDAVDASLRFPGLRFRQQEAAVDPIGRITADALIDHASLSHVRDAPVRFGDPAAVEAVHPKLSRQIHAEAHQLMHRNRQIAAVFQHRAAREGRFRHAVKQPQTQLLRFVREPQLQRFSPARLRQTGGHGRAALVKRETRIAEFRGERFAAS